MGLYKTPKVLVLGIDFRFQNEIIYFLNGSGLKMILMIFNLAGSSLGFNQNKFKEWAGQKLVGTKISQFSYYFIFNVCRRCSVIERK